MSQPFVFEVPWPPSTLSPNARCSRKEKATETRKYRETCRAITAMEMKGRKVEHPEGRFAIDYEFLPPPRSKLLDDDNGVGRMKAARDGIADALGINDRQFRIGKVSIGDPRSWGAVRVTIHDETTPGSRDDGERIAERGSTSDARTAAGRIHEHQGRPAESGDATGGCETRAQSDRSRVGPTSTKQEGA